MPPIHPVGQSVSIVLIVEDGDMVTGVIGVMIVTVVAVVLITIVVNASTEEQI